MDSEHYDLVVIGSGPAGEKGAAQAAYFDKKVVLVERERQAEEELAKLRVKTKEDARSVRDLTSERTALTTRLKDREYELREKRKLVEVRANSLTPLCFELAAESLFFFFFFC